MNQQVPDGVVITTAQIYTEMRELSEKLTTLIVKLDNLPSEVTLLKTEVAGIKNKLWFIGGMAIATGGGAGWIASVLGGA